MKPKEKKPDIVYRIINRATGAAQGSYSRAYCDEYDFGSVSEARTANCHGVFADRTEFAIAKYRVTYELIEEDADPPNEQDLQAKAQKDAEQAAINAEMDQLGITNSWQRAEYTFVKMTQNRCRREYLRLAAEINPLKPPAP